MKRLIVYIVIISIILIGCDNKDTIDNYNVKLIGRVYYDGDEIEIYKSFEEQCIFIVNDGNIERRLNFDVDNSEVNILELPNLDDVEEVDITYKSQIFKYTWEASFKDAIKQIKYYLNNGYEIVLKAETRDFLELYLKHNDIIRRVLVFNGYISIADVDSIIYNIDNYIY